MWTKLVEFEGELLVELLSEKVEGLRGVSPTRMLSRPSCAGVLLHKARYPRRLLCRNRDGLLSLLPPVITWPVGVLAKEP